MPCQRLLADGIFAHQVLCCLPPRIDVFHGEAAGRECSLQPLFFHLAFFFLRGHYLTHHCSFRSLLSSPPPLPLPAFLRVSMSFMERLLDEKARAKLVIVDGRTVKLERYITSADPLATLSYRE